MVETLERVERKKTYAKGSSKVVKNTIETNSKLKNTDKDKIIKPNVCKANYNLCGHNKIKGGDNTYFAIENKMSDGKNNEFTPEKEQKVEDEVVVSQCTNGSRESNYNMNLKSDNV